MYLDEGRADSEEVQWLVNMLKHLGRYNHVEGCPVSRQRFCTNESVMIEQTRRGRWRRDMAGIKRDVTAPTMRPILAFGRKWQSARGWSLWY
jgi:hypothetical protein